MTKASFSVTQVVQGNGLKFLQPRYEFLYTAVEKCVDVDGDEVKI